MSKNKLIYLFKYILSSSSCYVIDFILFVLLEKMLAPYIAVKAVLAATIGARMVSSLCNYFINSRYVFKVWHKECIVKYYIMVVVQMCVSAVSSFVLCSLIHQLPHAVIKMGVDFIIFIVNYIIQKTRIFV